MQRTRLHATGAAVFLGLVATLATFPAAATGAAVETLPLGAQAHAASVARKGWKPVRRSDPSADITITFAVRQQGTEELTRILHEVSDPESPSYGQHLTAQAVHDLTAPLAADVSAVHAWLASHGVAAQPATPNSDFLRATVNISVAERLLGAECAYWDFEHAGTGQTIRRLHVAPAADLEDDVVPYHLPARVASAVDFVAPTITFPLPSSSAVASAAVVRGAEVAPKITPSRLRALMNLTDEDIGRGAAGVKQGVSSFLGQFYADADTTAFRKKYKLQPIDANVTAVPASQKHSPVGVEASMDLQYITSTGNGVTTEMWSTPGQQPGNPENEPFVAWLTDLSSDADPPVVFSISYGDEEVGVSYAYAQRCAVEFQKAGARGITLLAASGDAGVGCSSGLFVPTFPASCPYVTGVGAVHGGTPGQSPTGETVFDISGGGFSNYFGRPAYQDAAVAAYTSSPVAKPDGSFYNHTGAGFPDVAAQGELFDVCTDDFFYPYSGTSAASPSAAGVISLLAQDRADRKESKLGWINPLLYKLGAADTQNAFNDVTEGTNSYCDADTGFSAARGWDPVSGWGSLNYGKLRDTIARADRLRAAHARVRAHPADASYTIGINKFSDRRPEDVPRGYRHSGAASIVTMDGSAPYQRRSSPPPQTVDWRDAGAVSPVRDQGQGSTCWAFSTAGSVEGARVAVGKAALAPLSPQYLIDCMGITCSDDNGTPDNAFKWVAGHHNGSMYSFESYPYMDAGCVFWDPPRPCLKNGTLVTAGGARVTGMHHTIVSNETDLMLAVAQQPVSVAIATPTAFVSYTGGVFDDSSCHGTTQKQLDHAVLIVGYTEDAWIVKNSWGPSWGEKGFVRMKRGVPGSGICGIAIDASFPTLSS